MNQRQMEGIDELKRELAELRSEVAEKSELAELRVEVAELTRLIKIGNGHASLMDQAARNSDFREWAEPFIRNFPMTLFKWWIATMLTLGGMIFGMLKLIG